MVFPVAHKPLIRVYDEARRSRWRHARRLPSDVSLYKEVGKLRKDVRKLQKATFQEVRKRTFQEFENDPDPDPTLEVNHAQVEQPQVQDSGLMKLPSEIRLKIFKELLIYQ